MFANTTAGSLEPFQIFAASPPYSSTTCTQSACVRLAIEPG